MTRGLDALRPSSGMRLGELLTLGDQTDERGRLLLEDSAPTEAIRKVEKRGVPMRTERCPYRDTPSRLDGTMNVSAYEELRRDTAGLLDAYAWLAGNYYRLHPSRRSTVRGLFDTSYLAVTLPLVVFYRELAPLPPYRRFPAHVASMFKAGRGVFSAAVDMLNEKGPTTEFTPADIVRFADERSHLARPDTGRVCAAPTAMIERVLGVILTAEGGDAAASGLDDVVDFRMLWEFYTRQVGLRQALNHYGAVLSRLLEESGGGDPAELFGSRVRVDGKDVRFGELTEEFLGFANALQGELNRVLGRTDDAPPLGFRDVLELL